MEALWSTHYFALRHTGEESTVSLVSRGHWEIPRQPRIPTPQKKKSGPFLYKNILFKRQFKNKNSVQLVKSVFFLYQWTKCFLSESRGGRHSGPLFPADDPAKLGRLRSRAAVCSPLLSSGMVCLERKDAGLCWWDQKCSGNTQSAASHTVSNFSVSDSLLSWTAKTRRMGLLPLV